MWLEADGNCILYLFKMAGLSGVNFTNGLLLNMEVDLGM
jgi:hypothetical protein